MKTASRQNVKPEQLWQEAPMRNKPNDPAEPWDDTEYPKRGRYERVGMKSREL